MSMWETPVAQKKYLTFPEVRELYGIGRKMVANLVRARQLRRRMVDKAWRYPVADLENIFSSDTRNHVFLLRTRTIATGLSHPDEIFFIGI